MSRSVSLALEGICRRAAAELTTPSTQAALEEVMTRLRSPLRVAVAGRRGAGKSTLVNVIIGAPLAPTDLRECTQLVTSFRHGSIDCVEVVELSGARTSISLDADGLVPTALPCRLDEIDHLDVTVTSGALRELTVIDTPGLATTDVDRSSRTQRFLGLPVAEARAGDASDAAVSGAEAVLYVLGRTARADDAEVMGDLHAASSRVAASPINTVAVLNQIDRFARRGDPWDAAVKAAQAYREAFGRHVVTVVPLVGVLAETLLTGRLGHHEIEDLRALAATSSVDDEALDTVQMLVEAACPIPVARRQLLANRLTMYGVREAVVALRAEPMMTGVALHSLLLDRSGQPGLETLMNRTLRSQADALKASWAVAQVELAAANASGADRTRLRAAVEEFVAAPEAHQLRVLEVAQSHAQGLISLPELLATDLRRLLDGLSEAARLGQPEGTPRAELAEVALTAMNRWGTWASSGADPAQARAASQIRRAYHLLWRELSSRVASRSPSEGASA